MFKFERFNRFFTEFERFKGVYERWTVQQVVNFSNGSTVFLLILNGSSVKKNKKIFERFKGSRFLVVFERFNPWISFQPLHWNRFKGFKWFFFFSKKGFVLHLNRSILRYLPLEPYKTVQKFDIVWGIPKTGEKRAKNEISRF